MILLVIALESFGCADRNKVLLLYNHEAGSRLPETSVSRVITSAVRSHRLHMKLDGLTFIPRDTLEILPGKHTLVLGWTTDPLFSDSKGRMVSYPWSRYWVQYIALSFSAEAGHVYELKTDTLSSQWEVDLTDRNAPTFLVHSVHFGNRQVF